MSRIFVTGDTHGQIDIMKLNTRMWPEQKDLTKDDYLIICGDFGLLFNYKETGKSVSACPEDTCWGDDEIWLYNWYCEKPFTILWVDGNHECVHKDSDVLTSKGWVNIVDAFNDPDVEIATMDLENNDLIFAKPLDRIKLFKDKMIYMHGYNYGQCVSENHDIVLHSEKCKAKSILDKDIKEEAFYFVPSCKTQGIEIDTDYLKLITAIIMDGTWVDYNIANPNSQKARIQFHLKRKDKIEFIKTLIEACGIKYTERYYEDECFICFYSKDARDVINFLNKEKCFPKYFCNMSEEQFEEVLSVMLKTDATLEKNGRIKWRTVDNQNYDVISALCAKFGYSINVTRGDYSGYNDYNTKEQMICGIKKDKKLNTYIKKDILEYNDYAYCFTMPYGTLITRYKDKISLTGNCFDRLAKYPVEEWHGGKVQKISDNIIHLMRGQYYDIDGKTFFTMGGARSTDRGITTGTEEYDRGKWWWDAEMPTEEEFEKAKKTLEEHGNKVDFILTHEIPFQFRHQLGFGSDRMSDFLGEIKDNVDFLYWFCGHYHCDTDYSNISILYRRIMEIADWANEQKEDS